MYTGMLWFDNSSLPLETKVRKAIEYYHKKYGRIPDLCLVHPAMLEKNQRLLKVDDITITVRPYRPILMGHLWIGVEDK